MLFSTRLFGYDRDDIISNMLVTSIKQRSDKKTLPLHRMHSHAMLLLRVIVNTIHM